MSRGLRIGFGATPFTLQASQGNYWWQSLGATLGTTASPPTGPIILYTDFTSGPISGGEGNNGMYLSIFGINLGNFSDYGTVNHVTIGGVEVANYRCLVNAVGDGGGPNRPGNGVFETFGIKRIVVQVGALGSPTLGVALPIQVSVNGINAVNTIDGSGNLLDFDGNPITFTPNPGVITFFSLTGNDTNSGTIASPKRHLQTWDGSSQFGGGVFGPASGVTTGNNVPPGSFFVIRGGEWGGDFASFQSRWVNFFRKTGTAPTGSSGSGPLMFCPYPGPAGSNTPEIVTWTGAVGSQGAFQFADSSRGAETNVYGNVGWAQYVHIAHLKITSEPSSGGDAAPINIQYNAVGFRIVNCELVWKSTLTSPTGPTAGGIAGYGSSGRRLGNYIHDIYDASGAFQNHGTYIGNGSANGLVGTTTSETHSVTSFNCYQNCTGGQGIMARGFVAGDFDSAPYISIHHNFIVGQGKYGIEFFDNRIHGSIWSNTIDCATTGLVCIYTNSDAVSVASGIYVGYNTLVGAKTYSVILQDGGAFTGSGSIRYQGNVVYQRSGAGVSSLDNWLYNNRGGGAVILDTNAWFDATGNDTTKPAGDTNGYYADPKFVDQVNHDFHPAVGSPLPNTGTTTPFITLAAFDEFFIRRPQGINTKWAIGALERIGG